MTLGYSYQILKVKYSLWATFKKLFTIYSKYIYLLLRFVEHGEYKENLYGTSLEAIRSVMTKKKVCLVDVVPEVSSNISSNAACLSNKHCSLCGAACCAESSDGL